MSTAVTQYDRSPLPERAQYAQTLAGAADLIPRGLFDKATGKPSAPKILLVMETGAMLGLHPMAALQGIDVIEGKATISPQLMTGIIRSAGHRLIIQKTGTVPEGTFSVTVTGTRSDTGDVFTDTWDLDRAVRAGLCSLTRDSDTGRFKVTARSKAGEPLPWEKYPELMCTWRAIGVVGREGFDDVLKGISYTPEELGAVVDEAGEAVDVDPEPSEDWAAAIEACDSKDAVSAVVERAKAAGEFTDAVRTLALTRYGMLNGVDETDEAESAADEDTVNVEPEPDEPGAGDETEYERISAQEYADAVARGDVVE